ncbi:hypothetical protein ALQ95_03614 [Pseudomonas syringae pv. ribicola]|uniref:Cyclophilin-like domain-containing protein n=2 Tax=Pseudomonas TaxID=286 RepID=A0A3M2VP43_PSESI|nr:hypothetical protein ALQ95_03614 [Pseudomonas syringae pv. ribicola]
MRHSKPQVFAGLRLSICLGCSVLMPLMSQTTFAQQQTPSNGQERGMNISMFAGDKVVMFHLEDSATTRDFVAMLPLELTLEDYAATEKIGTLPRKLDVSGAAAGSTPVQGDIAYYAPWGNLAIYHKGFEYSPGLVSLGRVESGIETIRKPGAVAVRFEVTKD